MPTMTDVTIALLAVSAIVGFIIVMNAIRKPADRREMGIRLSDDDFDWDNSH